MWHTQSFVLSSYAEFRAFVEKKSYLEFFSGFTVFKDIKTYLQKKNGINIQIYIWGSNSYMEAKQNDETSFKK